MRKYPFTPELLDALPEELAELFRGLEDKLLEEICSRLNLSGQLNEVTVKAIRALRSHGIPMDEINKAISETTKISEEKLNKLLDDVVARNQAYYTELVDISKVTAPERLVDEVDIAAIMAQTQEEFTNITRSMGFLVDHGRTMLPPAKAYQHALDSAILQIQSGAISYNQAISGAVKELADSGLRVVNYESGHIDAIDTAARRAVMTGVNQLNQKYREQSMDYLGTDLVEVSAHAGARDVDGPMGWENHKAWQGKVYRWAEKSRASKNSPKNTDASINGKAETAYNPAEKTQEKPYADITREWRSAATPNSHEVKDLQSYSVGGVTYTVDGRNVVLDYSPHEKEIAELLEREFGGEIFMVPRVNNPQGVSTPDYLFQGLRFDLKTIYGTGKNTIYDAISKKREQAENFILDLTNSSLSDDEVERQIVALYKSHHALFVDRVIVIRNGNIIHVLKREK